MSFPRVLGVLSVAVTFLGITPLAAGAVNRAVPGAKTPLVEAALHQSAAPPRRGAVAPARVSAAATPHAAMAATAVVYRNMLISDDGTLQVALGVYSDCTGRSPLPRIVAVDTCVPGRTYFIGHNPGNLTPLRHMQSGAVITWWSSAGTPQRLRIGQAQVRPRSYGAAATAPPGVIAQFQTCAVADGTVDWIYDAVAA